MEQTQKIEKGKEVSSRRFWKILFVFAVAFFVFLSKGDVLALDCPSNTKFTCQITYGGVGASTWTGCAESESECDFMCKENPDWTSTGHPNPGCTITPYDPATGKSDLANSKTEYKDPLGDDPFTLVFKALLYGIFKIMVWLMGVATVLFKTIIDPKGISFIMQNEGLYQSWAMVRDFLNLGFILVLLYIAFCVIFQIGSYSDSWKKMLLMMVIMALLVNFSFPICRVIIDFSNVAFYYLTNSAFPNMGGDGIFAKFADYSGLGKIISPDLSSTSVSQLIAVIIFTFIMALTLLVIAVLFVVRMVALGLLIVFSPIGFAGAAFPFSKKYAGQWWDNLFKYSFFAPIMMFMIIIATNILKFAQGSESNLANNLLSGAQSNAGADIIDPGFIANMAFFTIPIVILWTGMHYANELSIAGSKAVTGTADKFAKWVPNAIATSTGIPGGIKKTAKYYGKRGAPGFLGKIPGLRGSDKTEATEDRYAGLLTHGAKGWKAAHMNTERKMITSMQKEFEDLNLSESEAEKKLESKNVIERRAAALYLNKKDKIGTSGRYEKVMNVLTDTDPVRNEQLKDMRDDISSKAKKDNNLAFVINYEKKLLDQGKPLKDRTSKAQIYEENLKGMSAQKFAEQKGLHDKKLNAGPEFDPDYLAYIKSKHAVDNKFFRNTSRFMTTESRLAFKRHGINI